MIYEKNVENARLRPAARLKSIGTVAAAAADYFKNTALPHCWYTEIEGGTSLTDL